MRDHDRRSNAIEQLARAPARERVRVLRGVEAHRPLLCHERVEPRVTDLARASPATARSADREQRRQRLIRRRVALRRDQARVGRVAAIAGAVDQIHRVAAYESVVQPTRLALAGAEEGDRLPAAAVDEDERALVFGLGRNEVLDEHLLAGRDRAAAGTRRPLDADPEVVVLGDQRSCHDGDCKHVGRQPADPGTRKPSCARLAGRASEVELRRTPKRARGRVSELGEHTPGGAGRVSRTLHSGRSRVLRVGDLDEAAERVCEPHVFDRAAVDLE